MKRTCWGGGPRRWCPSGRAPAARAPSISANWAGGVEGDREAIDAILAAHSEGWPLHRMTVVDRNILRVACHELRSGLPVGVVVNEAVELANELSTEDSGRFVNGLLGRIAREEASVRES